MTTVILASGKMLREHPDTLRRLVIAYMKGTRDIQPPVLGTWDAAKFYTPEHLAIFEKYTGANERVLRDQVPYTWDVDLVIQVDSIMDQQLTHMRNGGPRVATRQQQDEPPKLGSPAARGSFHQVGRPAPYPSAVAVRDAGAAPKVLGQNGAELVGRNAVSTQSTRSPGGQWDFVELLRYTCGQRFVGCHRVPGGKNPASSR
jgi:hypothetical protein